MEKTIVNFSYTVTVVSPPVQVFAVKDDGSKLLLNTFTSAGQHSFLAQTPWTEIVGEYDLLSGPFTAAAVIGARDGGSGGQAGADGLSAYELAVQQGYEGDLDSWLASLKGEPGEKGEQGPAGEDGKSPYFNSESGHWMYWDDMRGWLKGPAIFGDGDKVQLGEEAFANEKSVAIGAKTVTDIGAVAIGYNAQASEPYSVAIGYGAVGAHGQIVLRTQVVDVDNHYAEMRIVAPYSAESYMYFGGRAGIVLNDNGVYTRIKFSELSAGGSGCDGDCGVSFGDAANLSIGKKSSAGSSGVVLGNYSQGSTTSVIIGNGVHGRDLGTCIIRAGDSTSGEDDLLFGFFAGGSPLANQYTDGEPGMGFWNRDQQGRVKSGCVKLADICTMHQGDFTFGAEVLHLDDLV